VSEQRLVKVEYHGAIAVVELTRPPVNALNRALIDQLLQAIEHIGRDPVARVVVVTGGRRAFSAGADVHELRELPAGHVRAWIQHAQRVLDEIANFGRPTIAAIEGYCLGGGLELAMACHLRVAGGSADLGLPEIKLGLIPSFGGTQRLPRLVGPGRALELMLTGDSIEPQQALELGLINRVAPSGQALDVAMSIAETLATRSATAASAILRVYHGGSDRSFREGLGRELDEIASLTHLSDALEGMAAFAERRTPEFRSHPPLSL
jgi:enoyl-CoA hydratase/carnithine racemase